jgi:hypothetical protein
MPRQGRARVVTIAVVAALATIVAVGALHAMASGPKDPEPPRIISATSATAAPPTVLTSSPEVPGDMVSLPFPVASSDVVSAPVKAPARVAPVAPATVAPRIVQGGPAYVPPPTTPLVSTTPAPIVTPSPPRVAQPAVVDARPDPAGGSLIAQASHALAEGETPKALALAHQAVLANPSDADAWLILGAACQAAGNQPAARDAYRSCVSSARTANVSECRLLAGQ